MQKLADLNYLAKMDEEPTLYMCEPPAGVPERNVIGDSRRVALLNGYELDPPPQLDKNGFVLLPLRSQAEDLYADEQVRQTYFPEVEQFLKEHLQADRVLAFDYNLRNEVRGTEFTETHKIRRPVFNVHNDYTERSAVARVRDFLGEEAQLRLQSRFAFINVWKPIRGPVKKNPLAICDSRFMSPADFVATKLVYKDRIGYVHAITYNDQHQWYYFPEMKADEALVFKCYDSDPTKAQYTAHTSFEDSATPPNAPPRESIEVRTMVFWCHSPIGPKRYGS